MSNHFSSSDHAQVLHYMNTNLDGTLQRGSSEQNTMIYVEILDDMNINFEDTCRDYQLLALRAARHA